MKRNNQGFTLIEVMIALTIFALLASAVALSNAQSLRTARQLQEQTQARWINQNILTQLRLDSTMPRSGKSDRSYEFAGQQWLVELDVAVEDSELLGPFVRHVEINTHLKGDESIADTLKATLAKVPSE